MVVVALVAIIPAAKERQISRALDVMRPRCGLGQARQTIGHIRRRADRAA